MLHCSTFFSHIYVINVLKVEVNGTLERTDVNICGSRIKEAREEKGITQAVLAARMQLEGCRWFSRETVSRIEHNRRLVTDIEILCFARSLEVSVLFLLNL